MAIDVEKILRPVDNPIPPFPPKYMMLAGGEEMVIRQVGREDIPDILCHVEPLLHVELARQGLLFGHLKETLLTLVSGNAVSLRYSMQKLLAAGATSGADLATGFFMAVNEQVNPVNQSPRTRCWYAWAP